MLQTIIINYFYLVAGLLFFLAGVVSIAHDMSCVALTLTLRITDAAPLLQFYIVHLGSPYIFPSESRRLQQ